MLKADPNRGSVWISFKGCRPFCYSNFGGYPVASFFLYKMDGIFQSPEDVTNHYTEVVQPGLGSIKNIVLQPDAKPGDIRFKDLNNDGVIDENDKVFVVRYTQN